MAAVIISGDSLTALADCVREAAGTTTTYTPSAMAEQLNSLTPYKLWTRPEDMPQYDKYCKRFGLDVLYLTCAPTESSSTVTFYVTTTDSGSYLVEYGSVDEDGFTTTDSVTIASGTAFSDDLGTDSTYVVLRITAVTGGIAKFYFTTSSTSTTYPVLEVWGRLENPTHQNYQFNNTSLIAVDVIYPNAVDATTHSFFGAKALEYINAKNWVTSNVTTMQYMFYNCSGLTALDVSGFDTSKVTSMRAMFYGCSGLTELDLSGWDTSNVTTMCFTASYGGMFGGCESLVTLNMGGCDLSSCTSISEGYGAGPAFAHCYALENFTAPSNIKVYFSVSDCTKLTVDSLNSIIAGLYDYSDTDTTVTLSLGSTNLAKLTDDEIAVATAKGWTVA